MKAVTVARQGEPVHEAVETVSDWPEPRAGSGEAIVRTEASALNHLDLWVGRGLPGIDLEYPRIGGSDGCGIVESVGDGVDDSWIGRRVLLNAAVPQTKSARPDDDGTLPAILMIGEHTNGAHAAKFTAPVSNLLPLSGETDPVEAVAIGLVSLTAWRCLVTRAGLRPGDRVLITGIGGGVSNAALQIALHFGCEVIVTSRHQWKLDRAIEMGASAGVLDDGSDWSREVRSATGKRGVHIALDSIGKATHLPALKSLARGGTYVTPGATTGPDAMTDLARIFWNQLRIVGSTMGDMREFREVVALFESGHLSPVVDKVFAADDARAAYARLESGEQMGKIVLRWS
ncbi:MAG: zinc-binding dehydrogenase [Phycisphaerales bacterium]